MTTAPFAVRRFCPAGARPDCFEVYDRRNGNAASFGMFRYQAARVARANNAKWRANPLAWPPTRAASEVIPPSPASYVVLSACGRPVPSFYYCGEVPEGHVVAIAGRGGRGPRELGYPYPEDVAYFFVPTDEYRPVIARGESFIIDESRHQRAPQSGVPTEQES